MVDREENLIIVEGAVPGPKNGLVTLSAAIKMKDESEKKS